MIINDHFLLFYDFLVHFSAFPLATNESAGRTPGDTRKSCIFWSFGELGTSKDDLDICKKWTSNWTIV